ncbi:MAG TPA: N-acetylmuramic acid 6-phosphate etherase [Actinomycetes bacterium]
MSVDLTTLVTEGWRPEWSDIDTRSTLDLVRLMNAEDARVPAAVASAAAALAAAIDGVVERLEGGGRLVYVGAGTAGRIGVLDASECGPTFNTAPGQVVGVIAGGDGAVSQASESAEDDDDAGAADLAQLTIGPGDAVVAVSASGRTPYALGAVGQARSVGALTVAVTCNPGSPLAAAADHAIEVVVGPEVVSGSTRLKAGTAQKLVLNTISTVSMVRLGKTYGNLMVDVRAGNEKLRARAQRIVELATGCPPEEAAAALASADGEVRTAIVTLLTGDEVTAARDALARAGGRVREAIRVDR